MPKGRKPEDFKPRKVKCPRCKGTGVATRQYKDKDGKWHTEETVCDNCDGEGEIG